MVMFALSYHGLINRAFVVCVLPIQELLSQCFNTVSFGLIKYEHISSHLILSAIELYDLGRQQPVGCQCHQRPSGKPLLNS